VRARLRQTIARSFRQGHCVAEIAARYGIWQAEVEQALRRETWPQDFKRRPRRPNAGAQP